MGPNEFLHDSNVTREIAKQLLEQHKSEQGVYLVRRTRRDKNIYVLSLIWNGEFFNYEICTNDIPLYDQPTPRMHRHYYIDDGPYFLSLGHLVEHYQKYEDGLPGSLTKPIRPENKQLLMPASAAPKVASPFHQPHLTISNSFGQNGSVKSVGGPVAKPLPSSLSSSLASLNSSSSSTCPLIPPTNVTLSFNHQHLSNTSTPNSAAMCRSSPTENSVNPSNRNNLNNSALIKATLFKNRTLLNEQSKAH